jgi:hypothetical protein
VTVALGQPVTLTFLTYSDSARTTLIDATTVVCDVLGPNAVTTSYSLAGGTITRASVGTYKLLLAPTLNGLYEYQFTSGGTVTTSLPGSFHVDAKYGKTVVTVDDFALYINNQSLDRDRASYLLNLSQTLCESFVSPLPVGAEAVILDVAERAFSNPTFMGGGLGLYSEDVGPFSTTTPGTTGGGVWLSQRNRATLRRLAGGGGAFTIDVMPATAGANVTTWGNSFADDDDISDSAAWS